MNNTEITAALRQMADEIDKSESQVDKQQWWRAERGDKFYYADPVNIYDPIEDNDGSDDKNHANHNYWKSEKDAQLHIDFMKATMEGMAHQPKLDDYAINFSGDSYVIYYPYSHNVPTFATHQAAKDYADMRRRYCEMLRGYIE